VRIDLNNLKTVISISMRKNSGTKNSSAAVEGDEVEKWKKVMENDRKYFD